MKRSRILYTCAAILVLGVFLAVLYQPIQHASYEQDMWWMVPLMSSITHGHPVLKNINMFFFDPYPTLQGDVWMNIYLYFVLSIFGFQVKYFIFTSLVLHILCALLFYAVLRKLGMGFRIAFFSGLAYLTAFIHFCSYLWPMATHHLFVIFFSFAALYFYFETERQIEVGNNWRPAFWAAITMNFLASFCQITVFLLPIGIFADIMISSRSSAERLRRYERWMPLFIVYLGYPVIRAVYFGLGHLGYCFYVNSAPLNTIAIYPTIVLLGTCLLFLFRMILQLSCRHRTGALIKPIFISGIISYLIIVAVLYFKHGLVLGPNKIEAYKLLLPYNFIYPICVIFSSFVMPFKTILSISPAVPYHMVPFGSNIAVDFLTTVFIIIFILKFFPRYKGLIVFAIFYIAALRYMRIDTIQIPSRHFIYVMPLFSIIFCSSFIYLYDLAASKIKLTKTVAEIALTLIFIGIFILNIMAIRFETVKGRLVNTFLIYDYIRISSIVKDDIRAHEGNKGIKADDIFINGVEPMPFNIDEYWHVSPDDPIRLQVFRYIFATALNDRSMADVNVNKAAHAPAGLTYKVNGLRVYDPEGVNIDRFSSYFDEAVKELRSGNDKKAYGLFKKAIEARPFFVNYILSKRDIRELGSITMGKEIESWVDDIVDYYNGDYYRCEYKGEQFHTAKVKYVSSLIKEEIYTYLTCLLYETYLEQNAIFVDNRA